MLCAYQTNIHSWRSLPWESCLGHTSKKKYMSFFKGLDLLGMTNRIMCMSRPVWGSPLSIIERIFFCRAVRRPLAPRRGSCNCWSAPWSQSFAHRYPFPEHSSNRSVLVCRPHCPGAPVGPRQPPAALSTLPGVRTRLYEFSRKVAMMAVYVRYAACSGYILSSRNGVGRATAGSPQCPSCPE